MGDNNERNALRELQEEARHAAGGASRPSGTSMALADTLKTVAGGVLMVGGLIIGYFWLTDPCFDFKLSVTVQNTNPDVWRIWSMDCSTDSGSCVCATASADLGCHTSCFASEKPFKFGCGMECRDPVAF